MYYVHDLYNNAVFSFICEGWHFTHRENTCMTALFY